MPDGSSMFCEDAIPVRTFIPRFFWEPSLYTLGSGWLFYSHLAVSPFAKDIYRIFSFELSSFSLENSLCRKPTRAEILRRIVAVVLSVSLLATKTPVLRRSHCVGQATAKPREHGLATDAFLIFSWQAFLDPENPLYRPQATGTRARYRRIFYLLRWESFSVPRIYPVCV